MAFFERLGSGAVDCWRKYRILMIISLLAFLYLIFFEFRIVLFVGMIAITALLVMFIDRKHIPFDISPVLFFSILIGYKWGPLDSAIFLLLGVAVPSLISGADPTCFFFWIFLWLETAAASLLAGTGMPALGILLCLSNYLGTMGLDMFFGKEFGQTFLTSTFSFIFNLFLFWRFSALVASIM